MMHFEQPCTHEHHEANPALCMIESECGALEMLAEKSRTHALMVGLLTLFSATALSLGESKDAYAQEIETKPNTISVDTQRPQAQLPLPLQFFLSRPGPKCMKNMIDVANAMVQGYHQAQMQVHAVGAVSKEVSTSGDREEGIKIAAK